MVIGHTSKFVTYQCKNCEHKYNVNKGEIMAGKNKISNDLHKQIVEEYKMWKNKKLKKG